MPIADLLGVHFDMQLLGKLTLSVATMLLISWAYRFYNARGRNQEQQSSGRSSAANTQPALDTSSSCKPEQPDGVTSKENTEAEIQSTDCSLHATPRAREDHATTEEKELFTIEDQPTVTELKDTDPASKQNSLMVGHRFGEGEENVETDHVTSRLTSLSANQNSPTSQNGRRSPYTLKKLEGGVGVGRELRQEMGHQGAFSTFLSKAEIKVEDADLILEGPGNKSIGVRGKIYDYYVESSSHSVSDLSPTLMSPTYGLYKGGSLLEPQPLEFCHLNSSSMRGSRTPSPLPSPTTIRDPVLPSEAPGDSPALIRPVPVRPTRYGPIRTDSYLSAASNSNDQIPIQPQKATLLYCNTTAPCSNNHVINTDSPSTSGKDTQDVSTSGQPSLETVARAKFVHFPSENAGNSELESLAGKLDLGNCLEALHLAKNNGHVALKQAALRVMSENYLQILKDPSIYDKLNAGDRDEIQKQRMRGRQFLMVANMESPEWSRSPSQPSEPEDHTTTSGMYYYDDYEDSWHLLCNIPQEVLSKGCAMCTMDNYLFVAVGFQGNERDATPSKKVFCYNPVTSIWSEISPMNEARPHCQLVALMGHVYAIGGECLSTVERYDPRTNRWTFVASLPNETFAVAHRATACNGEIFVSGGTLKYALLRYSPKTNTWRKSMLIGSREKTTEMVAVKNFLYRFDVSPSLGISVYRYHVVARLWYECCSKRLAYCPAFQCATLDDTIYCMNRQFTMRFSADEVSPCFVAEDLRVLSEAKGMLFPFVLILPDKTVLQTCV